MKARTRAILTPSLFILALVVVVGLAALANTGLHALRHFVLDEESRQMVEAMNR